MTSSEDFLLILLLVLPANIHSFMYHFLLQNYEIIRYLKIGIQLRDDAVW